MWKIVFMILGGMTLAGAGSTAYFAKQYVSKKDALMVCEETLEQANRQQASTAQQVAEIKKDLSESKDALISCEEALDKQKAQLSVRMKESQTLEAQLEQANRRQESAAQQVTEIKNELEDYQKEKTKSEAEQKALLKRLSKARRLYEANSRKVEGLRKRIAEFREQQEKYEALIKSLKKEIHSKEIMIHQFKQKLKIELVNQILFGNGSTRITASGKQVLDRMGAILKDLKENHIFIVGHTDNVPIGPELVSVFPSNWELSAARSAAVVRYLVGEVGVDPSRCVAVGRSFYNPLASNETVDGRTRNRRAEVIIAKSLEVALPDNTPAEALPSKPDRPIS